MPSTVGYKLGHGSADDARVNNPRNIVTPSAAPSHKAEPTVSSLHVSGGATLADTTTTQQRQDKDDTPLIRKPKLTASHESLNSTASSGLLIGVHSSSEKWGQDSDIHVHTKKPKLTASHESLNSTTSSGQQISVHSGGERWGQQDTDTTQKPTFAGSHDSLNSTSSSGQQSSMYGERWKYQERESHPHTNSKLIVSHESLNPTAKSGQQPSVHTSGKRLSDGAALKKPSGLNEQNQHLITPARDVTKVPVESDVANVTPLASASIGTPNTMKFGNEVERPLKHVQNQASTLPSTSTLTSSSIKLEAGDAGSIDELNDLDRTTPTEERVHLPPGPIGVPLAATLVSSSAIHDDSSTKYQSKLSEHSEQQQLGDKPRLEGGLTKALLPSPMEWQGMLYTVTVHTSLTLIHVIVESYLIHVMVYFRGPGGAITPPLEIWL